MKKIVIFLFVLLLFLLLFPVPTYAAGCQVSVAPATGIVGDTTFVVSATGTFVEPPLQSAPNQVNYFVVNTQNNTTASGNGGTATLEGTGNSNKSFKVEGFGPFNTPGTYAVRVTAPYGRAGSVILCTSSSFTIAEKPESIDPTPGAGTPTWTPTPNPSECSPPGFNTSTGKCNDTRCVSSAGRGGVVCALPAQATPTLTPAVSTPTPTPRTPAPPCKVYEVTDIATRDNKIITGAKARITVNPDRPLILEDNKQYHCIEVDTAFGGINTDPVQFAKFLFGLILSLSGGIALILIIYAGYQLMLSEGNPEKINGAKETLTSAVIGLVFIIFSLVILRIIGVEILRIPGFSY